MADQWLADHGENAKLIFNRTELLDLDPFSTDFVLGLFGEYHVEYDDLRDDDYDPSLAEMTQKAIEMLRKNSNGFFLMVEGGRIDHAHHDTQVWILWSLLNLFHLMYEYCSGQ